MEEQTLEKLLVTAAKRGDTKEVRRLAEECGANLTIIKEQACSESPLHVAVIEDRMEVIKYLVTTGMDIDSRSFGGRTPLYVAAGYGKSKIVRFLIKTGADLELDSESWTPLHIATFNGYEDVVRILVKAGANVFATTI